MNPGSVWHYENFEFKDGGKSNKYLVVLNKANQGDPVLTVKTTSNPNRKNAFPGCCTVCNCYKVSKGCEDCFTKDTWVQLHDIYPFPLNEILKAQLQDKKLTSKGELSERCYQAILHCCAHSDDIPIKFQKMIASSMSIKTD